jgi:hypothetical protein
MQKTSEVYEKLFHYTTWDGLLGIMQSQTLWATHYKFLNDYTEIVLFRDKLIEFLVPYVIDAYNKLIKQSPDIESQIVESGGLNHVVQHDTEVFIDAQYHATGDEIYVLSFCGQHKDPYVNNNGLLSQWRAYGIGGGFALVFDTKKLEELLGIEAKKFSYSTFHIADLVYSNDENKLQEDLSTNLSIIAEVIKLFFHHERLDENEIIKEAEKAYSPFVQCISRYKHRGFSEENEVRVVALPSIIDQDYFELAEKEGIIPEPEKERKFRRINGHDIPYIELFNSIDIELPIEKIIVGPHKDKETRAAALRTMFRKTKIAITCSDIPYIG